VIRATLRNPGWCETLKAIVDLGVLTDDEMSFEGLSYGGMIDTLAPGGGTRQERVAAKVGVAADSTAIQNMEWLGMFEDAPIPLEKGGTIDAMTHLMLDRMSYGEGERDMIVLHHEFFADFADHKERITSTLIDCGIPKGDSAMSRTVGLPAAVVSRFLLEGKVSGSGVHIPVDKGVYIPVLDELERLGIKCEEKSAKI